MLRVTSSATSSSTTSPRRANGKSASSASTSATGSSPATSRPSSGLARQHSGQEVLGALDVLADQLRGSVGVALAKQRDQGAVLIVGTLQHFLRVRHELDHLVELGLDFRHCLEQPR